MRGRTVAIVVGMCIVINLVYAFPVHEGVRALVPGAVPLVAIGVYHASRSWPGWTITGAAVGLVAAFFLAGVGGPNPIDAARLADGALALFALTALVVAIPAALYHWWRRPGPPPPQSASSQQPAEYNDLPPHLLADLARQLMSDGKPGEPASLSRCVPARGVAQTVSASPRHRAAR